MTTTCWADIEDAPPRTAGARLLVGYVLDWAVLRGPRGRRLTCCWRQPGWPRPPGFSWPALGHVRWFQPRPVTWRTRRGRSGGRPHLNRPRAEACEGPGERVCVALCPEDSRDARLCRLRPMVSENSPFRF